jgi:hypothetical protein
VPAQCEFDDRAINIPIGAGLSLRTDAILESHIEVAAPLTDVIWVRQSIGVDRRGTGQRKGVVK